MLLVPHLCCHPYYQEHEQKPPKPPFRLRTRGCVWWCTFLPILFSSLVSFALLIWGTQSQAKTHASEREIQVTPAEEATGSGKGLTWDNTGTGIKTVRYPACQVKNFCKLYNSFLECTDWTHYHFAWRVACQAYTGAGPAKTPEIVGPWARAGDRAHDQSCVHTKAPVLEKTLWF